MILQAIIHEEDGGFWAEVPALPGCATQADTIEELKERLKEVIECHLAIDVEHKQKLKETDQILEVVL